MEENELEEGEAFSDQEDDSCIDPDIALSYIDEKLQDVLGHFQKDFEGGVSAENLGSKFGGYGSFLPTYQRSPLTLSQPRSPVKVPNPTLKSPYTPPVEGACHNPSIVTASSISRNNTSSDNSVKKETGVSTLSDRESIPLRDSLNRFNSSEQKMLKVRIKVGNDNILARDNAAIYSGLGLDISPSSSLEDSSDGSGGLSPESGNMPDESPGTILQIMTCSSVPGGYFLSPLQGTMLQVTEKHMPFFEKCKTNIRYKNIPEPCEEFSDLTPPRGAVKGSMPNKLKPKGKKWKSTDLKNLNCIDDISLIMNSDIDIETTAGQEIVSDALNIPILSCSGMSEGKVGQLVEESSKVANRMLDRSKEMKNDLTKGKVSTPGLVIDKSKECMRSDVIDNSGIEDAHLNGKLNFRAFKGENAFQEQSMDFCRDSPHYLQREKTGKAEKNNCMDKTDSNGFKVSKVKTVGIQDHVKSNSSRKHNSGEQEEVVQEKDQLFEDKGKQLKQGSQIDAAPLVESSMVNLGVQSSGTVKEKKKSSHARVKQSEKKSKDKSEKKSKDKAHKVSGSYSSKESFGDFKGDRVEGVSSLLDSRNKDIIKSVKPEHEKEPAPLYETSKERFAPLNETSKERFAPLNETSKERPGTRKIDKLSTTEAMVNEPRYIPMTCSAVTTEATATLPAPVVIEEHWVCCDICQKWRLLPYGTNPDHLPKKWQCSLLNWLPGMNSCSISEEETTKALNALYMAPAPEVGMVSDGLHDRRLEHNFQCTTISGKRKSGPKDATVLPNHLNPIQVPNSLKKSQQDSMKSRNSDDVNQHVFATNSLNKAALGNERKSMDFTVEKQKSRRKDKHKNPGEDLIGKSNKHSKSKSKRVAEPVDCITSKKTKKEDALNPSQILHSDFLAAGKEGHLGNVLSTKSMPKTSQKFRDVSSSKDRCVPKGNLSASSKRIKDEGQVFFSGENKDLFSSSDVERFDKLDFSSKKRRVKEWQESQLDHDARFGSQQVLDRQVFVKETLSESKSIKEEESRAFKSDGKVSKLDGKVDKGRVLTLPSSKGNVIDGVDEHDSVFVGKERLLGQCQGNPSSASALGDTSSSSKVSGSRKNKSNFQESRGSPVDSVSSLPLQISKSEKVYNKNNSVGKDEAVIVGLSALGSTNRGLNGEANEGRNHREKRRKETACIAQQRSLETYREGELGTLGSLRGARDIPDEEANQISGGKATEDTHLRKGSHDDLSATEAEETVMINGGRNLLDQQCRYVRETPDKSHAQDLDKNYNHPIDVLSHRKSGKSSSSRSKEKNRSYRSDSNQGSVKDDDLLAKGDLTPKYSGFSRREDHVNYGMQKSDEAHGSSMHPNQHKDFDLRAPVVDAEYGKSNIQENKKMVPGLKVEKSSHFLSDQDNRSDLVPGAEKSQHAVVKETQNQVAQIVFPPDKRDRLDMPSNAVNFDVSTEAKQLKKPDIPNGVQYNSLKQATLNVLDTSSPVRKDGHSAAYTVLKEARDLKHTANRLKTEGRELESTGLYFEAALKFLHVASLWEPLGFDSSKQGDATQSMQMYSETAKLCEFCAHEYERCKEMAAAALAYKCVEVAYLKAAYYRYPGASKDRHELQTALQMVPPGESPSSSASDVDNLNNQGTLGKIASVRGVSSPQVAVNHVVSSRNHPHMMRLLTYTNDINCAFEATRKSQIAIAAAGVSLGKDGVGVIASVREVLDFNFHNIKGLLRLVRLSVGSITH
ncbi:cysteine-tryptophan domain-containing zinc finger protein 7-like isoform X1 [Typha angustifolia]|uniref:cysteine-tryptophan domain-containing zinc finger protein 7-like isoform X1 n=1 Tax=Typha angustifolia TaxID=59011 RepID=UPI003C2F5272